MTTIIKSNNPWIDVNFRDHDYQIGRMVGGVGWPAGETIANERPGYICVIGEDYYPEPENHEFHKLYLFEEFESHDKGQLIKHCLEWQQKYRISQWFGRNDQNQIEFINHWNAKLRPHGSKQFWISEAVHSKPTGLIGTHIDILRTCMIPESTMSGQIILKWTNNTIFATNFSQIGYAYSELTDKDYPSIAAVGYAVSYLREYLPDNPYDEYDDTENFMQESGISDGY